MTIGSILAKRSQRRLGKLRGKIGKPATFDYVVVGGGTAGIVMAVRLAESGASVALIEAGHHYEITSPLISSTPGGDVLFVGSNPKHAHPVCDWQFVAENQPGANNRPIHFARGKCLGGSSARNFMIYQRPTIQSCQMWADALGDDSYTFENLLPYYQKSVRFTPPDMNKRPRNAMPQYDTKAFSPSGAPLDVSYSNYAQPFSTWLGLSFSEMGFEEAVDFNSGSLMGYQYCSSTIKPSTQTRASSESSFLKHAVDSKLINLQVYSDTKARRILFNARLRAIGVEVSSGDSVYTLGCRREVVVCAGAFQSPQLLMLSGMGPAETLQKFNIPVIANLPGVGQNMWDHPTFGPSYPIKTDSLTKLAREPLYLMKKAVQYQISKKGPLTSPVADWLAWEKIPDELRANFSPDTISKLAEFPEDWPEVEYISGSGYVGDFGDLFLNQPKDGREYGTILSVLITPLSRGNITLKSADPNDLPIINPNWLEDKADQELALAAYKRAREAFHSRALAPIIDGKEAYPGEEVQTDEQIINAIRNSVITLWHPACTCKMGSDDDAMAVLDSCARVRGVSSLRVVDASSFPFLPPGHPQSSVYMLAEKIADQMVTG